jgi:predicted nucleotidyltransferase
MLHKKDNKILFGTVAGFKIAELIFNEPHKIFYLRNIARETECSTTAITDAIKLLSRFNIINVKMGAVTKEIRANLDGVEYKNYKLVYNLYKIMRYNFLGNFVDVFRTPECIVVFGSFAKGEDMEGSDIDTLVITNNESDGNINKIIQKVEKEFNRKVNLHTLKSLDRTSDEFKNSVANGIVLYGYLKVI